AHDVPLGCAPDEYDDLISGTCSHLPFYCRHIFGFPSLRQVIVKFDCLFILKQRGDNVLICYERERYHGLAPLLTIRGRDLKGKERVSWLN
ncbi:hypothetical protein V6118_19815, partial [Klebsiella pneumoniae]